MSKEKAKFHWTSSILVSLILIIGVLIVNYVNTYGKILKSVFIYFNIGFLLIALLLILITIKVNNSHKKTLKRVYTGFLAVLLLLTGYGYYVVNFVNSNIKGITTQEHEMLYEASFVAKKGKFKDVEELKSKTVGLIKSENFIEGNVLPKDELEKLEYEDVRVKTYESYPLLVNGLMKDEIDFISLPKSYETLFKTEEQISMHLLEIEPVHTFSGKYANTSTISSSNVKVTEEPFTMLIMGNDGGRTDSLMLASVNPKSMQITLTSIARDSYVPIACYPNQGRDKINHARQISRDCTITTVENLLDTKIDFFVEISFMGLVDLVDALGTITIDSPAAFYGNIEREGGGGVFIPEGVSELNGDQALAFVRERGSFKAGDFQRQLNQQQAIASLISKLAETRDVNKLMSVIEAAGKNIETNLSVSQLIDLMNLALVRMDSTYLNSSEIVTIYGNRITGHSQMRYSPDYGFDLYYYIPYKGSIEDAKALIAMNTRADGILEIPKGFNYSAKDEYEAPVFGKLEYYESFDDSIFTSRPEDSKNKDDEDDRKEIDNNGEVILVELYGKTIEEANAYLAQHNFSSKVVEEIITETDDQSLIGKTFVRSNTAGDLLNNYNKVIDLKVEKYIAKENEVEVPDPEESEDDGEVVLIELKGKTIEEANTYLAQYNFKSFVIEEEKPTKDESLIGKRIVMSDTGGVILNNKINVINLKVIKYIKGDQ